MADMIIIIILASAVGLIIRNIIKNKKEGKSSCGCDCSKCGLCEFELEIKDKKNDAQRAK